MTAAKVKAPHMYSNYTLKCCSHGLIVPHITLLRSFHCISVLHSTYFVHTRFLAALVCGVLRALWSLVSVHDRGEWIVDLDILSTFDSPRFHSIIDQPSCLAGRPRRVPQFPLVSIDSWQELLDIPLDAAVEQLAWAACCGVCEH